MRFRQKDRTTPEGVFWVNFGIGIIFNIFCFIAIMSVTYSIEYKNRLKTYGALLGGVGGFLILLLFGIFFRMVSKFKVAAVLLSILFVGLLVAYIVAVYMNRFKIYEKAGYYEYRDVKEAQQMKEDIIKELSNSDYQIRYYIEYGVLRNCALQMNEKLKETFFEKEKLIKFLLEQYKEIKSIKYTEKDFDVLYSDDKDTIVIKLPETTGTALCNMIGIKVESKRFFAFSSGLVEWIGLENPMRGYINFKENDPQKLLEYLTEEK